MRLSVMDYLHSHMDQQSRRNFLKATGAVAAAAGIAGCAGDTNDGTDNGTDDGTGDGGDTSGGTLNRINPGTVTTFDPVAATDTSSGRVITQVFDALLNYQGGTATVGNRLASEVEVSDDFLTYTISIEEDAVFHNGNDVTASDLMYSFERLAQSDNSRRAYFILDSLGVTHETDDDGNYVPDSLGLEAVDEKTLEIQLSSPFHAASQMLAYSSFAAVPEGLVGDIEGYDGELDYAEFSNSQPIGAGPFEFDEYQEGTEISVTAFEDYYLDGPQIDGVHWQVIEKDNPRYNYAMNRNADLFGIPTSFYEPSEVNVEETDAEGRQLGTYTGARNGDTLNYAGVPTIDAYYVGFNMAEVPAAVRKAVAYVANQELFVSDVFKGRGQPAYHFTPPSIYPGGAEEYQAHAEENYPYGYNESLLDEARAVMEEAGYGEDNRYSLGWTQYQSDTWLEMAQILRDRLSSVYVDMEIEQAPFSTLLERGRNGNLEAYTLGWISDWPAPDNFLQLLNPPQTDTSLDAPISYLNWQSLDTEASQQAADAYQTVTNNQAPTDEDQTARNEAYVQIEEANWEDVGFLPVYHSLSEIFWYDTVTDFTPPGGMGLSRKKFDTVTLDK